MGGTAIHDKSKGPKYVALGSIESKWMAVRVRVTLLYFDNVTKELGYT
jgi:hypothetical protein